MKKKKKKYMEGGVPKNNKVYGRQGGQPQGSGQDYSKMTIEQLKQLAQKGDKQALAELKKRMQQQQGQQQGAPRPPQMKKGGKKKMSYGKKGYGKNKKKMGGGKKRQNLWD